MNLLIVDDQKTIVKGLRDGIDWKAAGIDEVHTACNAREAKLVLMNFDIEILLTDIEMPEENGMELLEWTKTRYPEIVAIFLTSHADFEYARQALKLGSFDYILQPARYEDVQHVVERAVAEARKNVHIKRLEEATQIISKQRDVALELMLTKSEAENYAEGEEIFKRLQEMFVTRYEHVVFYPCWIQIVCFEKIRHKWNAGLLTLVFRNVLEEILEDATVKACIAQVNLENYLMYVAMDAHKITQERWQEVWEEFTAFFNARMDFRIAVYPDYPEIETYRPERDEALKKRILTNCEKKPGIFYETEENLQVDENEERIRLAKDYVKTNINRSVTRSEVAEYLHLNEEYFSRLFKKYTGYTFKDYEMMERIEIAKCMLEKSRFSVSIIASRVGYDNFSHFSKVFKKYTDQTPQEYRKNFQK